MSLKHDDLYASAWECEYEKPIFDAENNIAAPPKKRELPAQSDLKTEEARKLPGNAQESSQKFFLKRNI